MFDIGFIELMLVGLIALLVIGPEQLPHVAVKAGKFIGQIKRTTHQWTGEINRQIDNEVMMAELKKQNPLMKLDDEITQLKALRTPLTGETLGKTTNKNERQEQTPDHNGNRFSATARAITSA